METLDFTNDERQLKIRLLVNGKAEEFIVTMPKWKHSKELTLKTHGLEKDSPEYLEILESYLVSLGISKEALGELDSSQMRRLSEKLGEVDPKKLNGPT